MKTLLPLIALAIALILSLSHNVRTSEELTQTQLDLSIVEMENTLLLENLPADEWSKGYEEGYHNAQKDMDYMFQIVSLED